MRDRGLVSASGGEADRFGNPLDGSVGYARGRYIGDSAGEIRRLRRAQAVAAARVAEAGSEAIAVFTGNPRYFPLRPEDLDTYCEEWVGPGLFLDRLSEVARAHFGGGETAAVLNRTSAGVIAAVLALGEGAPVVSLAPPGERCHSSLVRGCALAGAPLVEVSTAQEAASALAEHRPALMVVTTVTSALARLDDETTRQAAAAGRAAGATVLLDEAYGARLRPILHGGAPSLALGADLAITNADKAGLAGPRAGVLCGASGPVLAVLAKAYEMGQEARAPIAAGAMRSLMAFDPEDLRAEARDGRLIADALAARWGEDVVRRSDLGPMVGEEDVLARILGHAGRASADLAPAEATTLVGMLMLERLGVLTVNTHGAPGGRVSIRLKPVAGALERVGGAERLVDALDDAVASVAGRLDDASWIAATLFGEA